MKMFNPETVYPDMMNGVIVTKPWIFNGGIAGAITKGKLKFVDGTSGSDGNTGDSLTEAKLTVQAAVTAAGAYGIVYVIPKAMAAGSTDPGSYEENIIIPATHECLSIIGIGNRTQGGLPQLKVGTTTTSPILTIRAPGCTIANLGFNGDGATGGGILLDDDGSTKSAFGTEVVSCHFKNCKGTTATDARTGGAIQWAATGGAWQVWIHNNRFYKNVGDIVLLGTSASVPQDVIIEGNDFSGPASSVDCNLYLAGGSGMTGLVIKNNTFNALPAVGSGSVVRFMDLTGCTGIMAGNTFAAQTGATGGTRLTFVAAGTAAKVPSTVIMSGNFGQSITASETGEVTSAA